MGSRHVPLDQIGRETAPKGAEIVVYRAGPECPQSAMAFEKLKTLGYANVKAYEGGLEEREAAGASRSWRIWPFRTRNRRRKRKVGPVIEKS